MVLAAVTAEPQHHQQHKHNDFYHYHHLNFSISKNRIENHLQIRKQNYTTYLLSILEPAKRCLMFVHDDDASAQGSCEIRQSDKIYIDN